MISFTENGFSLAKKIQSLLYKSVYFAPDDFSEISVDCASSASFGTVKLSDWVEKHFQKGNCLVFIGAAGIAVRAIAPFIKDKSTDSAVLVIDEKGEFVVPILSGHIGGANEAARKIASLLNAKAVITTASDVNNLAAIDEFAAKNNLSINDMKLAKNFTAKRLAGENPEFSVSIYIKNDILNLIPKCVVLGIGCKKGKSAEELETFVRKSLDIHKIDYRSLEKIASIDLKKDEKAIITLADKLKLPFVTFSADELNGIPQKVSSSDFVSKITGTDNVCERAVFAAGSEKLIVSKISQNGMTLAIGAKAIEKNLCEEFK